MSGVHVMVLGRPVGTRRGTLHAGIGIRDGRIAAISGGPGRADTGPATNLGARTAP